MTWRKGRKEPHGRIQDANVQWVPPVRAAGPSLIITVQINARQRAEFDLLKERTHTVTDGAMVKKAIEQMIDRVSANYPAPPTSTGEEEKR